MNPQIQTPVAPAMNPMMESILPTKASEMPRTNLSTIQITDEQKDIIDQAYALRPGNDEDRMTKGEFLQLISLEYIHKHGGTQTIDQMV